MMGVPTAIFCEHVLVQLNGQVAPELRDLRSVRQGRGVDDATPGIRQGERR